MGRSERNTLQPTDCDDFFVADSPRRDVRLSKPHHIRKRKCDERLTVSFGSLTPRILGALRIIDHNGRSAHQLQAHPAPYSSSSISTITITDAIDHVLQERSLPIGNVYLASCVAPASCTIQLPNYILSTAKSRMFVLKDISETNFVYLQEIHLHLQGRSNLRLVHDVVLEPRMFVYKYLTGDLLSLVKRTCQYL
jgi:hypothetical protein